jgi:hypothetical protein
VLAFCDNGNEALAGMLRPGNAGANTAGDLIAVLDAALAQIPEEFRHGYPVLVRLDAAAASKALLAHIRGLREHGVHAEFSIGWALTDREHTAIAALPETAWTASIDADGDPREHAAVAELRAAARRNVRRLPRRDAHHRAPRTPAPRRATRPDRRT